MYVYVQTLIMLLRLGMHNKYINKNKNKNMDMMTICLVSFLQTLSAIYGEYLNTINVWKLKMYLFIKGSNRLKI